MTVSAAVQVPNAGGDAVLVERRGHVLLVTINRPDARNAVNTKVTLGIGEALDYADSSADVWVVIVTGAGDRSFCAGQDLKEAAAGIHLDDPRTERWGFAGFVGLVQLQSVGFACVLVPALAWLAARLRLP